MKKYLLTIFLTLATLGITKAQVISDPVFFGDTDSVTIIYDATKGTSALEGASSVYMHSGVITTSATGTGWENVVGNWGQADGVGEMTKVAGEDNLWEITLVPRSYYDVAEDTDIFRLGMVFREGGPCTSCNEGKSDANGDIYVNLSTGELEGRILAPSADPVVIDEGGSVDFEFAFSDEVDYTLDFGDGTEEIGDSVRSLTTTHTYAASGAYTVIMSITDGTDTTALSTQVIVRGNSPVAALPPGVQRGINYHGTDSVTLVLWAPNKAEAYALGEFNNWQLSESSLMYQAPGGDHFWITLTGLEANVEYAYQYLVDGTIRIADPFADKILDPDDQYIPESIYPNLKPYPEAALSDVWYYNRVSVLEMGREQYAWQTTDYTRPDQENLVIYELLVRDFLGEDQGHYPALIDTLDYLENLGVNAIELMPVMEFNGNDSWGYNPTFMFAPDKYYGTREGLKSFIDECHSRGIAVILDMVMNQNDIPAPYVSLYYTGSGISADNPFFNQQATHPFNVFFDFNHESEYTQSFLDTINAYWLDEYRFDGYRFDLSKGFTQTDYGDDVGAWSSYDAGRIALLKRMADKIWEVDEEAYVILEHFAANDEETELANYGMMLWGNAHFDYKEAGIGFAEGKSLEWAYAGTRGFDNLHLVSYMESHDEERQMYDMLNNGTSNSSYNIQDETTALVRSKALAAFLLPVPGPKMIWQFGEFGYNINIDFNGRTGRKPTQWEFLDQQENANLFGVYKTLIDLKLNEPAFREGTFSWQPEDDLKTWTITHEDATFFAVGNFGISLKVSALPIPQTGLWYDVFTGDTLQVQDEARLVSVAPGQFYLLSTKPVFADQLNYKTGSLATTFPYTTGFEEVDFGQNWQLYPNPTNGSIRLTKQLPVHDGVRIEIFDIFGARKAHYANVLVDENGPVSLDVSTLTPGMYLLRILEGDTVTATRFLKQ